MSKKVLTAVVSDPHILSLYDAQAGDYDGILYVTSGSIIGQPVVTADKLTVTYSENGLTYMNMYKLPSKDFERKIQI
jgi:hypothetical protein